jgi:hypothetical protein
MEVKMALQFDYTALDTEGWTKEQHDTAADFVWTMMAIDMREVTKENKDEIVFRIMFLQMLELGPWREQYSLAFVKGQANAMIGYKCNVAQIPRYKFIRRWIKAGENWLEEKLEKNIDILRHRKVAK